QRRRRGNHPAAPRNGSKAGGEAFRTPDGHTEQERNDRRARRHDGFPPRLTSAVPKEPATNRRQRNGGEQSPPHRRSHPPAPPPAPTRPGPCARRGGATKAARRLASTPEGSVRVRVRRGPASGVSYQATGVPPIMRRNDAPAVQSAAIAKRAASKDRLPADF